MAKVYSNLGFECMHLIGQNKHSKFTCYTLHILSVTMTCAELCWQTYLGIYSSAFRHIWALNKAFEKSNKCQRYPKIWVLDACILLARTNRQNWMQYFPCENDLCRAMLPNYSTWGHIPLLHAKLEEPSQRHLRSKTMAKVYPKSWFLMHAIDWPEQTLKIYMQYSTYFACNNDLCRGVLTNLLGDIFLRFLPYLSLEEGIWEEYQVPKVAENLSFLIRSLHLIG